LKRVVVAYQNQIVMSETLTQGLAQIFGRRVATGLAPDRLGSAATSVIATSSPVLLPETDAEPVLTGGLGALAGEAKIHYDNAERAQRAGDWALYGEEMKKLQDVLERMQRAR
jgi:uncharacterized membrane protein (UPF0182 family)